MKASNKLSLSERIVATIRRPLGLQVHSGMVADGVMPKGYFNVQHGRGGRIINEYRVPNTIVNEGKNHILNVQFHGTTPITVWHLGLVDAAAFGAIVVGDIYHQINGTNGWTEFAAYTDTNNSASGSTRPTWGPNAASGQAIANTTLAKYLFTGPGTLQGLFVVGGTNSATKNDATSGAANILWAATPFALPIDVIAADDLSVSYTVSW